MDVWFYETIRKYSVALKKSQRLQLKMYLFIDPLNESTDEAF